MSFLFPFFNARSPSSIGQTLQHDRKCDRLYHLGPTIPGTLQKKFWGQNVHNSVRCWTTSDFDREYLQFGPRYQQGAKAVINCGFFHALAKKLGKLWSTSKKFRRLMFTSPSPTKSTSLTLYIYSIGHWHHRASIDSQSATPSN